MQKLCHYQSGTGSISRREDYIKNWKADKSHTSVRIVQLLIEHGADIHAQGDDHSTPLHMASNAANAGAVQLLIQHGADVNVRNGSHLTPLLRAFTYVSAENVQLLVQLRVDVSNRRYNS